MRARTIVYNPDLIDEADVPTTYEELADPEWEGRICLRDSLNGYQQSLVASLIAEHGEDETTPHRAGLGRQRRDPRQRRAHPRVDRRRHLRGRRSRTTTTSAASSRRIPTSRSTLKWANQDDRGVHVNISGGGVTTWADAARAGPSVPRMAGDRRSEHPRRRQPRVSGQPAVPAEPLISARVRHRLRSRPAAGRRVRCPERRRRAPDGRSGLRLTGRAYHRAVPSSPPAARPRARRDRSGWSITSIARSDRRRCARRAAGVERIASAAARCGASSGGPVCPARSGRPAAVLLVGVAVCSTVLGVGLAWLVSAYRFPGSRTFGWLLILPLAMPSYILGYPHASPPSAAPGRSRISGDRGSVATPGSRGRIARRGDRHVHARAVPVRVPARPGRLARPGRRRLLTRPVRSEPDRRKPPRRVVLPARATGDRGRAPRS